MAVARFGVETAQSGERPDGLFVAHPGAERTEDSLVIEAHGQLDALKAFDRDQSLKAMLGAEFSAAFRKMKKAEWQNYASRFTQWERDNTLDV